MNTSILNTIKKLLGLDESYTYFDRDIVIFINTALFRLAQIGYAPAENFTISDETQTWDKIALADKNYELIKTYLYLKVKQLFDPSGSSTVNSAIEDHLKEIEWAIYISMDSMERIK